MTPTTSISHRDGHSIIIVAEAKHRLDFRDPRTMQLQYAIEAAPL